MMKNYLIFSILIVLVVLGLIFGLIRLKNKPTASQAPLSVGVAPNQSPEAENSSSSSQNIELSESSLADPIDDFKARITKKNFGQYFDPQNSTVSPERFTGYHTAVDIEYEDVSVDVPVYAVADGKITLSTTASGYGGVYMMEFQKDAQIYTALYGHIRPSSLPKIGTEYKKGQQIAVLGTGYSQETDNERRHLHFGILKGSSTNIKGYVQSKSDLSSWLDPFDFF